jgi:NAD(P)-dependent dehydrogenase (short-subunit alcohol dehydrogenase family)
MYTPAGLRLVGEIRDLGAMRFPFPRKVTAFAQVRAVADAAVGRFGRLDTWVHLAAVSIYAAFDQLTPEEFRRVIDVNLNGQAFGAMAAVPR